MLSNDLNHILDHTLPLWDELRNQRLFITGGTGFFGSWFLESFLFANKKLNLNATAFVLTRNKMQFEKKCPHLYADPALTFYEGDVKNFIFPTGSFSHLIHAATDASAYLNETNPLLMLETVTEGTKHTLEFAKQAGIKKMLLTSSGAVYGRQPPEISHLSEEDLCQPKWDDPKSAYAVGKCTAEHLCHLYIKQHKLDIKIARCFAFVGPYLPLDIHFAIGNFLRNGLMGESIHIAGDGTPYRSYLYAADLMIWLWTILFRGETGRPYNVGSDQAISIKALAETVSGIFNPKIPIIIDKQPQADILPERYVPDIKRAKTELGLIPRITLVDALNKTKLWNDRK